MNNVKAMLFDLVGTLIYPKDPVGYVYSNVARSFDFETDYRKLDEKFAEVIKKEIAPSRDLPWQVPTEEKKWWRNVVLKTFTLCGYELKDKFDDVFEELFKVFSQKSAWAIYPDVIPVLEKLTGGACHGTPVRIGLISNFDSRLEIILKELDLYKYFHCLAYSGKVGFSKPNLKIFQYALSELNVIPEEALYVGDSLNIDYYPACDLGMKALLIDREENLKTEGIKTISNLNQIFDFLSDHCEG
jgi:putative hydrolase of the HAD superfamily